MLVLYGCSESWWKGGSLFLDGIPGHNFVFICLIYGIILALRTQEDGSSDDSFPSSACKIKSLGGESLFLTLV